MAENDLNRNQMLSMQEDAIRRVREMQRRANDRLRQSQQSVSTDHQPADAFPPLTAPAAQQNRPPTPPSIPPAAAPSFPRNHTPFLLSGGAPGASHDFNPLALLRNIDNEKAILLILIVMFLHEGVDIKLILALCYLLF